MHELFGNKNLYSTVFGFKYSEVQTRGYSRINRLKPPELFIQDELHLISGPLGSLTGLYEVSIDLLTRHNGRPAKVIASTATISGAEEQIKAIYGREMMQFPQAVQKANDNFVSKEIPTTEKHGRFYEVFVRRVLVIKFKLFICIVHMQLLQEVSLSIKLILTIRC
jgi:hypothetical protein